jgi:alpha-ketoglutarate-dependent 2,4-dichlorophenoxyacetate dioxygenase
MEVIAAADFGAVVEGVRLDYEMPKRELDQVLEAWWQFAVLVFPDQNFDDVRQVGFSRLLGPLERAGESFDPILRLTNVTTDGALLAQEHENVLMQLNNHFWHTDSSFKSVGAAASLLSGRVIPSVGGQTEWADMRAAYDVLDENEKMHLESLTAMHELVQSTDGPLFTEEHSRRYPAVPHPMVQGHPITGRRSLYVGHHASYILGIDHQTGRDMLRHLTETACQEPRIYRHTWNAGDAVLWDNRCVLHRVRPWPSTASRTLHRTTIAGGGANNPSVIPGYE